MVRSMIALAFVLGASTAFAEVTIKPKLIHSQLTLDAKSAVDDEGIEEDVDGGKRWVPGKRCPH
ncbi:MAG TPA: hypothetical protein VE954_22175 [Oligoflexus sp.]|uniref:hypothetical protein n=1 Tax=Oligoflexus sp. TaxID=1971216 RepID=UPI002D4124AD|nr:hypothetical protein [Oligoflexus sp.]HYX35815.1 hypothetical protein [Oligoflexus sp.]